MRQKALRMSFNWLQGSLVALCLLLSSTMFAQITGTIVDDANDEPLIGASVLIAGTATGTVTDIDGNFSLDANTGDVLEVSYTGYSTQNITVGSETNMAIRLAQGIALDEVVVTGYSTQRERDITGAVAVVKADELNEVTATSFTQKLEGKVTGVTTQSSGAPGAGTQVRIRGISSFQNNDPLYVIDGVPTTDNFNTSINPNDIESIQVLKDASASSIYGARANNGVIIITTKRGKKGKTSVTYNATVGTQTPVGKYDLITDPAQYSEVVWRSFENSSQGSIPAEVPYAAGRGVIPEYIYAGDFSGFPGNNAVNEANYSFPSNLIMRANQQGTDWWDEVFSPALIQEHNIGVSGGGEYSTFAMNFGYLDQNGTMLHTDFDRFTLRANSEFKKGRFTVGENFTFARSSSIGQVGGNQSEQNTMSQILKAQSIIPVFDISGVNYGGGKANGLSNGSNPVAQQTRAKDNRGTFYRALGNAYLGVELMEGLTFRSSIGIEFFNNQTGGFQFPTWEESEPNVTNAFSENSATGFNWTWTNTLGYNTTVGDAHDIGVLVGYEAIKNNFRQIGGSLGNYFTTDINAWYLNTGLGAPDSRTVNSNGGFSTLASVFGKIDYSYDDTYLLSFTLRRDGSSNFGRNQRYGVFPAVSVGWRVSNTFLQGNDVVDDLKLRFGYGITGNQNIPGGNTVNRFGGGTGNAFYDITGTNTLATGYALLNRGNEDTKWEENVSINFGIDGSLLNGKLDFVLDLYDRTTDGLLFNPTNPGTAGSAAPAFINVAEMNNKGVDFAINWRDKSSSKFGYNIGLNLSHYRNEIIAIDGAREAFFSPGVGRIGQIQFNEIGGPIGAFYGWQTDGIFQSQAEVDAHADQVGAAVGQLRLKDLNGDGQVNGDDLGNIGSPHPDLTLGLNLGVNFGDIDVTAFFVGSIGNDIYNYNKLFEVFRFFNSNVRKDVLDRSWSPSNPGGDYPLINEDDIFSENSTDFYVEDGSYLRLRTLQVGYTFPKNIADKIGLGNTRIYLQGQNLLTITGYSGIDPALSSFNSNGSGDQLMGMDFGNYPSSKIIQFGINASF